jgi:hypothetical protein
VPAHKAETNGGCFINIDCYFNQNTESNSIQVFLISAGEHLGSMVFPGCTTAVLAAAVTHLGQLHLLHEAGSQVLQDNAIRSSEECQHVEDEVLLVRAQLLPVAHVVTEINLLGCST